MKLSKYFKDQGYTINKEFCGYPKAMQVVKFRGDYVSPHNTVKDAILACIFHDDERTIQIL